MILRLFTFCYKYSLEKNIWDEKIHLGKVDFSALLIFHPVDKMLQIFQEGNGFRGEGTNISLKEWDQG